MLRSILVGGKIVVAFPVVVSFAFFKPVALVGVIDVGIVVVEEGVVGRAVVGTLVVVVVMVVVVAAIVVGDVVMFLEFSVVGERVVVVRATFISTDTQ